MQPSRIEGCMESNGISCPAQQAVTGAAIRPRGAVRWAGQGPPLSAPRFQDCWNGSEPEPHWSYPAVGSSACATSGLPCWPVDKAGSDWTHEKVPQKQDQNALQS